MPQVPANQPLTFANGGPTGFELPRRFIIGAVELLAVAGVAVIVTGDLTWRSGDRPLFALVRGIRRLGYEVAAVPSGASTALPDIHEELLVSFPDLAAAAHVGVIIERTPDTASTSPAMLRTAAQSDRAL